MLKELEKSIPSEGQLHGLSYADTGNDDLFELSVDMQAIVDSKGSFQRFNNAFADRLGLGTSSLPASFLLIVHEADRQTTLSGLLNHPHPLTSFENRCCCNNSDSFIWISWSMVHLANGHLLLTGRDVTNQKEAEEFLNRKRDELETIVSSLEEIGFEYDPIHPSKLVPRVQNMSEKQQQEQIIAEKTRQLDKAHQELSRIIENSSEIIFKLDHEGIILFISPEFEKSMGYSNKEVTGKLFCKYIHIDDQSLCCKAIHAVFETRRPAKNILTRAETKDGSWRWLNISFSVLWDEELGSLFSIGFAQDITDMKQTLESLRESEERYAAFIQHSSEAIWRSELIVPVRITDPEDAQVKGFIANSYLAECNDQMATAFGFESTGELIGVGLSHFTGVNGPHTETFCRNFIRNGYKLNRWPSVILDRQGVKKHFLSNLIGIVDNGLVVRIWGTLTDITEQRKAEKALRESEERFRQLANTAPVMIWVTDTEGQTTYVNQGWTEFTGVDEASSVGYGWLNRLHPEDVRPVFDNFMQQHRHRLPFSAEYRVKHKDGEYRWVVDHGAPRILTDGTFAGYVGSIIDIHERKWQEQLLALEKEVLEINAQPSATLSITVSRFFEGIEKLMPDMICSMLTLDEDGISVRYLAAPSMPAEYSACIDGTKIGPYAGSCGTAMYLKKMVITSNIQLDPLWDHFRPLARRFGLQACWSLPILNNANEVLATMAAYYRYPRIPTEKELGLLERVANLLRIIIENKKAEARIRISNERYLLATKATNDAIWDWDVSTGKLFWGDGFFTLFGYSRDQRVDSIEFWEKSVHPDDRYKIVISLKEFMQQRHSHIWEAEYRFRKSDGKYALVHDRGFLIFNHTGDINRMTGSMQDITEQKELEKKLLRQELNRQKQVAQAVVDAQEKERADIGKELHDNVNQILSTAKLYLELSKNDEAERLNLINRSTKNISDAINEIRSISRSLVPASIGDLGLIESIQDLVENIQATKKLHIEFYHAEQIDALISEKQKLMIFRIVQEQVNNVLKHAEAHSLIIELVLEHNMIDLTISDDGKGFDPEKLKTKKGVGLYNISSRTELFNGKVNIIAAPGKGCKLNIRVPILNQ